MSPRSVTLLLIGLMAAPANADGLHVVRQLNGYKCMMLNISEQQAMDPTFHIPVYAEPSLSSPEYGYASAQVAVRDPVRIVNGFEEALFPNGATVWIRSEALRPYHSLSDPKARCVPALLSNGKRGFDYPHG